MVVEQCQDFGDLYDTHYRALKHNANIRLAVAEALNDVPG